MVWTPAGQATSCLVDGSHVFYRHFPHSSRRKQQHRQVTLISTSRTAAQHQPKASDARTEVPLAQVEQASQQETKRTQKKQVRFCADGQLERVRFFLKTQQPNAIRGGDAHAPVVECMYPNWPEKLALQNRRGMIRMEAMQQVAGCMAWTGRCRVANLAFQKHIVVRYTADYWQSYHENEAVYREPISSCANTWDRFTFFIDLRNGEADHVPPPRTIYLALRFAVNGHEYWDNNAGLNYQIDVREVACGSDGPGTTSTHSLRKQTMHGGAGPVHDAAYNKELSHRYDFGASLSAAKASPLGQQTSSHRFLVHHSQKHVQVNGDDVRHARHREHIVANYCFYGGPTSTTAALSSPCASPELICG